MKNLSEKQPLNRPMPKWFTFLWMLGLLVCLSTSCVTDGEEDEPSVGTDLVVGDPIPDFSVTMSDGRRIDDEALLGQVSLIVFFHTGCKDCQKELPVVQRFYDSYPQYPVVCVSRAETENSIAGYWKENGLTLPYSAQSDKTVFRLFATQSIPRVYVVDAEGIIRAIFTDNPLATFEQLEDAARMAESK